MALAGYSTMATAAAGTGQEPHTLWRTTYHQLIRHQLSEPYLRVAFAFLAAASHQPSVQAYHHILFDTELPLRERAAFACRFLPDDQLLLFLRSVTLNSLQQGSLDGLLLTGLGDLGLQLIQQYVDVSSDVQSAAALGCYAQSLTPEQPADERIQRWITTYHHLLNQWKLWLHRAKMDVARALLNSAAEMWQGPSSSASAALAAPSPTPALPSPSPASSPASSSASTLQPARASLHRHRTAANKRAIAIKPQVYARCNYCYQSLAVDAQSSINKTAALRRQMMTSSQHKMHMPLNSARTRGCPSCKKELPKCALCLVSLDCATSRVGGATNKTRRADDEDRAAEDRHTDPRFDRSSMNPFSQWFTWCQACRHGGHADHITDWFKQHVECPVTDCNCHCLSLDFIQATSTSTAEVEAPLHAANDEGELEVASLSESVEG